jgi:hypothetical protein
LHHLHVTPAVRAAPAIILILAQISDYTNKQKLYLIFLNEVMLVAGGLATIPELSWSWKSEWKRVCLHDADAVMLWCVSEGYQGCARLVALWSLSPPSHQHAQLLPFVGACSLYCSLLVRGVLRTLPNHLPTGEAQGTATTMAHQQQPAPL